MLGTDSRLPARTEVTGSSLDAATRAMATDNANRQEGFSSKAQHKETYQGGEGQFLFKKKHFYHIISFKM